jgi:CelD/BcsL family acetyltransferase involved in cellulose biosynthesis
LRRKLLCGAETVLTVHCARSLAELASSRDELDAINRASRLPDPFSTFGFYEIYVAHDEFHRHGVDTELWFLTVRENGAILGYLPLRRVRERVLGMAGARLEFLATHDNDRPHLVARPADEQRCRDAVLRYLHARRREWSFLDLRQQTDDSALSNASVFSLPRYYARRFPNPENGSIQIRWDTLRAWFGSLSHKMRSNIGRQFRALASLGRIEHLASSDPAATPLLFELYRTIEPRSWKAGADATISRSPRRVEFFRRLLDPHGPFRVRIDLLLLDGVPIAGLLCAAFERRLYAMHIVFDDAFAKVGPGSAVLLLGMREAIEGCYLCFNLLSGFSYYKTRWQAEVTKTHSLQVYRMASPRFLRAALGGLRRALLPPRELAADFNPARRETAASASALSVRERDEVAGTVAELARRGVVAERLEALARSLPFEVRRGAKVAEGARAP